MHSLILYIAAALCASTVVNAHGKIAVAGGDAGGNTTALGIMGGSVPGAGPNRETETDTTIFNKRDAASDGLGRTKGNGENTLDMMAAVLAQSGNTLPQVSNQDGYINMTYHIVTTDGAGPVRAIVDPTGTGQFSQGREADVVSQVPGNNGNIRPGPLSNNLPGSSKGGLLGGLGIRGLTRRALNVNTDHELKVAIPAGTTCSGTVGNLQNVCLLKVANPSGAGPFGGVIAFQMVSSDNSTSTGNSESGDNSGSKNSNNSDSSPGNSDSNNYNNDDASSDSSDTDSKNDNKSTANNHHHPKNNN